MKSPESRFIGFLPFSLCQISFFTSSNHTTGLASTDSIQKVDWDKEVLVVWNGCQMGTLKVICGTSMYDYGTLGYVEGMSSVEALKSRPSKRVL